jgi:hypothetical protein
MVTPNVNMAAQGALIGRGLRVLGLACSVAVTAVSDTLLAVFNLASVQGTEKRTAAYHPRRSLAGKAFRAGVSTVLEWTPEGELLQKTR